MYYTYCNIYYTSIIFNYIQYNFRSTETLYIECNNISFN